MKVTKEMVQFGIFIILVYILYTTYVTFFTKTVRAIDAIQTEKPTNNLRKYEGMEDHEGFISLSKMKNAAKAVGGAAKTAGNAYLKGTKAVRTGVFNVGKAVGGELLSLDNVLDVGTEVAGY